MTEISVKSLLNEVEQAIQWYSSGYKESRPFWGYWLCNYCSERELFLLYDLIQDIMDEIPKKHFFNDFPPSIYSPNNRVERLWLLKEIKNQLKQTK